MKNLIVLSHSEDYDVGGLVRYLIKMFDIKSIKEIFKNKGINIITSRYIRDVLNKSDEEYLKEINEMESSEDYMIFGIHPYGLNVSITNAKNIKKIIWLNDPHYLAHSIERNGEIVQNYIKKYDPPFIKNIDYLITPSPIYFKNLEIYEYNEKIKDFFYFLDEGLYEITGNIPYNDRLNKVILSGVTRGGYLSRIQFDELRKRQEIPHFIDKIDHPGYKDNSHMTEVNYYSELTKYKGAFVGHHKFPLDFLLAKHIEVLMCGCLGFFEPNPLLKEQLGLVEFEHYIPCFNENGLIEDPKFYINWMQSEEGEKIANNGKKYVRDKFGKKYILEFIKLINQL